MKLIGITGGVGSGKSRVLDHLVSFDNVFVVKADELAHRLTKPGGVCFKALEELFGTSLSTEDGELDKAKIAGRIFKDASLREGMNNIVHPEVKKYILNDVKEKASSGLYSYYFLEAALLIEEGYDKICDELWYIYTDENIRRERLKSSRGYSNEKINDIIKSQSSDGIFKKYCKVIINNSGEFKDTVLQIDKFLEDV
ncbi:MAG: dephospho-CoA kinase [Lachnospiraceae bacterium]|nr:dephospho-CoA kinase [Lachnospiraceae bacterium]